MKAVIQRVTSASVSIGGTVKSSIGPGLLVLLGVGHEDTQEDLEWLVKKVVATFGEGGISRLPPSPWNVNYTRCIT